MSTENTEEKNVAAPQKNSEPSSRKKGDSLDYTVHLIIPISFDCEVGRLKQVEKIIESKTVMVPQYPKKKQQNNRKRSGKLKCKKMPFWHRSEFQNSELYNYVEELFDNGNQNHVAAIYYSFGNYVANLTGCRNYYIKKEKRADKNGNTSYPLDCGYTYQNLILGIFETGLGFLCMEISIDKPFSGDYTVAKIVPVIDALHRVMATDIHHYQTSNREEYPLLDVVRQVLATDREMQIMKKKKEKANEKDTCFFTPFFAFGSDNKNDQAFTLVYTNLENNAKIAEYSDEDIITSFLRMNNQCNSQSSENQTGILNDEKLMTPFTGMTIGIGNGASAFLRRKENTMPSNLLKDSIRYSYLPLIMLSLHQKYAVLKFLSAMNQKQKNPENVCRQISLFKQKFTFTLVSDTSYVQSFFENMIAINKVSSLITENQPKYESLLVSAKDTRHDRTERATGLISILFALMGIASILNDGMEIVDKLALPEYSPLFKIVLLGLCVILLLIGIRGLLAVSKSTK